MSEQKTLWLLDGFQCNKTTHIFYLGSSAGSEWDYVIISLVRSLKEDEIDPEPTKSWLREHLGFLEDEHQMNVGLTRARRGLCLIGKKRSHNKTVLRTQSHRRYHRNNKNGSRVGNGLLERKVKILIIKASTLNQHKNYRSYYANCFYLDILPENERSSNQPYSRWCEKQGSVRK